MANFVTDIKMLTIAPLLPEHVTLSYLSHLTEQKCHKTKHN